MLPAELPLTPEEIKRLIKASGHSQRTVATQIGVREATVSKWVNGVGSPSHGNADKLRALSPRPTCQREWTTYVAVGCLLLVVGAMVFLSGRSQASSAPAVARAPEPVNTKLPVSSVAGVAQESTPVVFDLRTFLGAVAGQMGKKLPMDQYVPTALLPGQKPPPCLTEAGEVAIGGGCWFASLDVKPPCGRYLFRNENTCYRPVAADPQKPVGETPRAPDQ